MNINEIKADLTSEAKPGAHLWNSKGGVNDLMSLTPSQLPPGHQFPPHGLWVCGSSLCLGTPAPSCPHL